MNKVIEYFVSGNLFNYRVAGTTDFITLSCFDKYNTNYFKKDIKRFFKLYCDFDITFKRLYHKDLEKMIGVNNG